MPRLFTPEHREKLRQAKLRNPVRYWAGKTRGPHAEAVKEKISAANRGRPKPATFGPNLSARLTGVPRDPDTVAKMTATMRTPVMRAHMASQTYGKPLRHAKCRSWHGLIEMKSSYEVRVAAALDRLGVPWQYEPARFDLGGRTYAPDFYLPEDGVFWEVKGWYGPSSRRAVETFRRQHGTIPLVLAGLSVIQMLEASAHITRDADKE